MTAFTTALSNKALSPVHYHGDYPTANATAPDARRTWAKVNATAPDAPDLRFNNGPYSTGT